MWYIYIYIIHIYIYIFACLYTHNGILLSHKKNEMLPFATTWMDLECIMFIEISQRQVLYVIPYMCNLRKQNEYI